MLYVMELFAGSCYVLVQTLLLVRIHNMLNQQEDELRVIVEYLSIYCVYMLLYEHHVIFDNTVIFDSVLLTTTLFMRLYYLN